MARSLVTPPKLPLHRGDVDDVRPSRGRGSERAAQPTDQDERRGDVAELDLQQLNRIDLLDLLGPAVDGIASGTRPPASIALPSATRSGDAEPAVSARSVSICGVGAQCDAGSPAVMGASDRPLNPGGAKLLSCGSGPACSGAASAAISCAYACGGAAHRLRGVVDQDVKRPSAADRVGQRDHLRGSRRSIPTIRSRCSHSALSGIAVKRRDASLGEAGGDGGVGAVAQQPQRDVHADLGPAAGEQRPPAGQVGPGVPARPVPRRAGGQSWW